MEEAGKGAGTTVDTGRGRRIDRKLGRHTGETMGGGGREAGIEEVIDSYIVIVTHSETLYALTGVCSLTDLILFTSCVSDYGRRDEFERDGDRAYPAGRERSPPARERERSSAGRDRSPLGRRSRSRD